MTLYCKVGQAEETTQVDQLKLLFEAGHVCPTAPDTLRCFPFREDDPFVMDTTPNVFFAGCQPEYQATTVYESEANPDKVVKLISVPTFAKTRSIVLLDLETLQSYEVKFGKPLSEP